MSSVPVLVLRAAGINCDEETTHCWRLAGAEPTVLHVNALLERPHLLDRFAILTIPGGFSYGDDVAAGVILAQKVQLGLADSVRAFVERGGGVFGICNGFQVLVKMGLLPGGEFGRDQVTVTYNDSAHFEARWVRLEACTDKCPFVRGSTMPEVRSDAAPKRRKADVATKRTSRPATSAAAAKTTDKPVLELPIEHAEGKVVTASEAVTRRLFEAGQVALRYVDAKGQSDTYPANPNGSVAGIAGLCDATGRVFGLMPHPDRHFDHTQHPQWTRRQFDRPADGLTIFINAVEHWRQA